MLLEDEVLQEVPQEVVLEVDLKSLLNLIVIKVSTLPVERKICCVPKIWFLEKVFMEKSVLVSMYFFCLPRMLMELKLSIVFGILSEVKSLLVFWADWTIFTLFLEPKLST